MKVYSKHLVEKSGDVVERSLNVDEGEIDLGIIFDFGPGKRLVIRGVLGESDTRERLEIQCEEGVLQIEPRTDDDIIIGIRPR